MWVCERERERKREIEGVLEVLRVLLLVIAGTSVCVRGCVCV